MVTSLIRQYNPRLARLRVVKIGPHAWRLLEDFANPYQVVPAGFVFDGASVPRMLWSFLDPAGEAFEAACVHDYFYETGLKTKEFADKAFKLMLILYGVNERKAEVAYRAVRRFGRGSYSN